MDERRFDRAVRALAAGASRRGVLKRLAGGGAAAAGLALGGRAAGAAKGDCGPCKTRSAGGRCEYQCNRTCEFCDVATRTCVCRRPIDQGTCEERPNADPSLPSRCDQLPPE